MDRPVIREKRLKSSLMQFVFPFSINPETQDEFKKQLRADGFEPFSLRDLSLQDKYYGEGYRVSHQNMKRYYLPFTGSVLFPHQEDNDAFLRYSRALNYHCVLKTKFNSTPFRIHSADVILCPFDLGFITIRTQILDESITFTQAVEFANRFRVLQDVNEQDETTFLVFEDKEYPEIEEFIFKNIAASTMPYLDKSQLEGAYFETMPFFVDERMYVTAFYQMEEGEAIDPEDRYRAARIDGMDYEGQSFISSTNKDYINEYLKEHSYDRWGSSTYYVMDENSFCCLTNEKGKQANHLANQMYGEYYYGLLLNLFHKIVLLKLSNRYSSVSLEQNPDEIEDLIRSITKFSAKYFFLELVTQSQGREIFVRLRKMFGNIGLYEDVKQTLNDLFKYQGNLSSRRSNYLLMILTIYTVLSGIYGMNQVIEDWKGAIDWSKLKDYSIFEYLAMTVALSGILVSLGMAVNVLYRLTRDKLRKRS